MNAAEINAQWSAYLPKADDLAKFLLLKKCREAYESHRAILVTLSDLEG